MAILLILALLQKNCLFQLCIGTKYFIVIIKEDIPACKHFDSKCKSTCVSAIFFDVLYWLYYFTFRFDIEDIYLPIYNVYERQKRTYTYPFFPMFQFNPIWKNPQTIVILIISRKS